MSKRKSDSSGPGPSSSKARVEESASYAPLATRMQKLLFKEEGADVHFLVGDPSKGHVERIPAIVAILCAASDVFEAMFYGSFERRKEVDVPDADPRVFKVILRYIYTDEMHLNMEDAIGVLYLAKKYMLTPLVDGTTSYIAEHLTPENVCLFLDCADVLDDIKTKCWSLIDSHTTKVINSDAFLQLSQAQLGDIVKRNTLRVEEIELYNRLIYWAHGELGRTGEDLNTAAIRGVLGSVLFSIRFPLMNTEDFSRGVAKSGILTAEEVVEVLLWRTIRDKPTSFSCEPRGQGRRSRFEMSSSGNYMENGSWCANNLCVTVHHSVDESLKYQEGVIRFTTKQNCDVYFDETDKYAILPREYLRPVKPDIGDVARIIHGEDVGLSGNVISMDGSEAVIKMASGVRLIDFKFLCKAV